MLKHHFKFLISKPLKGLAFVALFFFSLTSSAVTFTSVTAIGDSLFDGGNEETAVISAYKLWGDGDGFTAKPGYFNKKYCDGYTAAEYLAYYMGLYDKEHFFNYSVAGTGTRELPLLLAEIYKKTPALDPTGLYVIFTGAHDVFQSQISREQSAENIKNAVLDLRSKGARYFLVMNLPKLSDFPNYNILDATEQAAADSAYTQMNAALKGKLNFLSFAQNIVQFDTENFSNLITQYALTVGFTDITTPCFNDTTNTFCDSRGTYIYWDDVHFTNITNSYLGSFMHSKVLERFPQ